MLKKVLNRSAQWQPINSWWRVALARRKENKREISIWTGRMKKIARISNVWNKNIMDFEDCACFAMDGLNENEVRVSVRVLVFWKSVMISFHRFNWRSSAYSAQIHFSNFSFGLFLWSTGRPIKESSKTVKFKISTVFSLSRQGLGILGGADVSKVFLSICNSMRKNSKLLSTFGGFRYFQRHRFFFDYRHSSS